MKKFSVAIAILMIISMVFANVAYCEKLPKYKINEAEYNGIVMRGNAIVPHNGIYYARIKFFLESGESFILIERIKPNGDFSVYVETNYVAYSVLIVDRPDAFVPGTFKIYTWFTCTLIGEPVEIP